MIAALANHLWQSTVFAAAIALLAAALRRNRADVRYRLWLAASVKFLVPFALLMVVGVRLAPVPAPLPRPSGGTSMPVAVDRVTQPFSAFRSDDGSARSAPTARVGAAASVWFAGFVGMAALRLRGWRRVRAALRSGTPIDIPGLAGRLDARSSPGLLEPGVVGVWRPVLLVPAGITRTLTPSQLDAVVAHELRHVCRRDNLTAAVHMIVEAVFWFHPAVWWIGARLVAERERACDEAVLAQGLDPRDYAEGIVNVCRLYVESPLACVAGVSGADIRQRIEDIMSHRAAITLNRSRQIALAIAAVVALTAPVLAGLITAPLHQEPRFEVASIRPCENVPVAPGGRGGGGGPVFSPGRFVFNCGTLEQLIQAAYIANGEPLLNDAVRVAPSRWQMEGTAAFPQRIRGGPSWARTEKYTIEAKAEISTGRTGRDAQPERKIMMGPMLRALLEERFQLALHRGIQNDVPMYAMTVAKGGLKITPVGPDGGCTPTDLSQPPRMDLMQELARVRGGGKPLCGHGVLGGGFGATSGLLLNGHTMDGIASLLSGQLDRHVLNRTGVEGKFIIFLEYAPDEHTPAVTKSLTDAEAAAVSGPNIFAALEKLGLKIEPAKGPKGYIVIDRAERPSNR
jgi:uncharacterized protein (TIGR03435 family)